MGVEALRGAGEGQGAVQIAHGQVVGDNRNRLFNGDNAAVAGLLFQQETNVQPQDRGRLVQGLSLIFSRTGKISAF